jgi:hypothetical protein
MPDSLFCQLALGLRPKCFFSSFGLTRHYDWTKRYQEIAGDAWHVKAGSAIIDGEVVVPSADGATEANRRNSYWSPLTFSIRTARICGACF